MIIKLLKILSVVMLLGSLGSWPYDYYTLLRVVVCTTSAWTAYRYLTGDKEGMGVLFGIMAVLFNPFAPIHLDRSLWVILDIAAACAFIFSLWKHDPEE